MERIHLAVDHLLVLAGVMLGLTAHELVLWWMRRGDAFHLWAAGWAAATVAFVSGHYVQRATGTPVGAVQGTILILSAAVALMPLSVGTVRSVIPAALPARALVVAAVGGSVLIGFLVFSGRAVSSVYQRTDAFGATFWDNHPSALHQVALAFVAVWSLYIVVRVRRMRDGASSPRRRATRTLSLFLLPLVVNDILHGANVITSVEVVGYGFCIVALGMSYAMTRRHERSLGGARALIQAAPDAILVHRAGRLLFVNPAAHLFLGYGVNELQGSSVAVIVPDGERDRIEPRYEVAESSQTATPFTVETFRRRDGSFIRGEVVRIGISFDGEPAGVTIVRDVSEREQVQRQLRLADRMVSVGTLAAGTAHEINNPLTYVLTNIDEALQQVSALAGAPDDLVETLTEAREGARRVRQVVRDIAVFSRSDEETIEVVDVCAVLESALSLTDNEIRHRATLKRDYGQGCSVCANPSRLGQVFVNLLVNAAQAIGDGSAEENEIHVVTRRQDDRVIVEIHDTGVGLPEEGSDRLFDPFYTTKPVGQGTGLGLSVCHGIVTAFGGTIELHPRPSGGAMARVVLAAASGVDVRDEEATRRSSLSQPPRARILVVDDEPVVARALRRLLTGHDVTIVASGDQALKQFSPERFDVIICDVMMPGMTGMDLYDHLRSRFGDIDERIIFMTGGAFTASARQFLRVVRARVIEKPFDTLAVKEALAEVLRRRKRVEAWALVRGSTTPPAA